MSNSILTLYDGLIRTFFWLIPYVWRQIISPTLDSEHQIFLNYALKFLGGFSFTSLFCLLKKQPKKSIESPVLRPGLRPTGRCLRRSRRCRRLGHPLRRCGWGTSWHTPERWGLPPGQPHGWFWWGERFEWENSLDYKWWIVHCHVWWPEGIDGYRPCEQWWRPRNKGMRTDV